MMLKTSIRNHIDLSQLADNKASTLLSVNALMITLILPLMLPRIDENPSLGVPTAVLMISCLVTIFLATLVTMPGKMKGRLGIQDIKDGKSDPFFFGNFYKMNYDHFLATMKETLQTTEIIENSAIVDLYMSGKVLGKKFTLLRICFMVFLIGLIISGIAFFIALSV